MRRDAYNVYRPASITCLAICRPSAIVSAGSCFASRRRIAICVRSISPSATAAITLRADELDGLHRLRRVVPGHRDRLPRRRFTPVGPQLLRAQDARFQRVHLR